MDHARMLITARYVAYQNGGHALLENGQVLQAVEARAMPLNPARR